MTFVASFQLKQQGAAEVKAALQQTGAEARKAGEAIEATGKRGRKAGNEVAAGAQEAADALKGFEGAAAGAAAGAGRAIPVFDGIGKSNQVAAGNVGYLVAQFNDLGVMMAAGQNPLQLALQQGTQITQVIGPMGAAGAVRALGTAFLSMLSPINLITIGGIAAGAALVQAFTDGGAAAESLTDRVKGLADATDDMRRISEVSLDDIIEKYGRLDERITRLIARQQAAALAQAMLEARQVTADLGNAFEDVLESLTAVEGQASSFADRIKQGGEEALAAQLEVAALWREFDGFAESAGMTTEQIIGLRDAMAAVNTAEGFDAQAAALDAMLTVLDGLGQSGSTWYNEIVAAQDALEQARASAIELSNSAPGPGWMGSAIGETNLLIGRLIEARQQSDALNKLKTSNLAAQYAQYGAGRESGEQLVRDNGALYGGDGNVLNNGVATRTDDTGKVGGVGGGSARSERNAVQALIQRKSQELAVLRASSPVEKEAIRNRELMAAATEAQRVQIDEVTAALEREKAVQSASDFFASGASTFLSSIVSGSASAEDALDGLTKKLIDAGIQALMLGEGPLAGILGTAGTSIFGALFGGGKGGTGSMGLPMPFADGGPIYGAGGPRDDKVPISGSPGEFMVNARATSRNRAVLEYINGGGVIGRFADGGAISGGDGRAGAMGFGTVINMPLHMDLRGAGPGVGAEVDAAVARLMPEMERRAVAAVAQAQRRGRLA